MNVLVTGATGLVGSSLVPFLTTGGHRVRRLVRGPAAAASGNVEDGRWDPTGGGVDVRELEGIDAAVHLAGENVAGGRWTAARKARIRDSRIRGTQLLCEALARLQKPPRVVVCASAVGYYGSRGDEVLTEDSPGGRGFLAEVCRDWEAAAEPAVRRGIRVVHLRIGAVLSPRGGMLAKLLLPFKLGLGGKVGSGQQYVSWIAIDDLIAAIHHALGAESLRGPDNGVSPNPVTNLELTKALGRVLSRPTIAPLPALAAKALFGEMADELLLASTRVEPRRLLGSGFAFGYPELEGALRHVLAK